MRSLHTPTIATRDIMKAYRDRLGCFSFFTSSSRNTRTGRLCHDYPRNRCESTSSLHLSPRDFNNHRLSLSQYQRINELYLPSFSQPSSFNHLRKQKWYHSKRFFHIESIALNQERLTDESCVRDDMNTIEFQNKYDDVDSDDHDVLSETTTEDDAFFTSAEQDADCLSLPKGTPDGFYILNHFKVPDSQEENNLNTLIESELDQSLVNADSSITKRITQEEIDRLQIDGSNVTLPVALMLLDPTEYPSFSKARKACRKGYIVIHRGPLGVDEKTGENNVFDPDKCIRGRVGDRVYPSDVIGKQVRMSGGFYPSLPSNRPPFYIPVIYEDDHFAIVNKPAGVVVYSHRKGGFGANTLRSVLPYALKPPKRGTVAIIRRPAPCHRLDRPTSGLLLVAKTKPAMVDITRQFVERNVKKTYTAILNGIPNEPIESSIPAEDARKLGVDIDNDDHSSLTNDGRAQPWQLIDHPLNGKSAVTVWRPLKYFNSLDANDQTLTLVEMKPKTGRYHQLRQHMALVRECPLVGDKTYDGGGDAMKLRGRGLFLCSNKVKLSHPYYNTEAGRKEWESLPQEEKWSNGQIKLSDDGSSVEVHASIDLPDKFDSFISNESKKASKFNDR